MNTNVSRTADVSRKTTPVAPVRSRATVSLERAQIASSHDWLLNYMAGPLYSKVARVFGGANAPLYLLTTRSRRQVWNACLAVLDDERDPVQLLHDFQERKSTTLLEQAYGPLPAGFGTALRKSGEVAQSADFYRFWFEHLARHPGDVKIIASLEILQDTHVEIMLALPVELQRVEFMRAFGSVHEARNFVSILSRIQGAVPEIASWNEVARYLESGLRPRRIVKRIMGEISTPSPLITKDERFRHLGTVKDIWAAGRIYQNCLLEVYMVEDALNGKEQFYEYDDGSWRCLVSLIVDPPFGSCVGSILGKKDEDVPEPFHGRILQALQEQGVRQQHRVALDVWNF